MDQAGQKAGNVVLAAVKVAVGVAVGIALWYWIAKYLGASDYDAFLTVALAFCADQVIGLRSRLAAAERSIKELSRRSHR